MTIATLDTETEKSAISDRDEEFITKFDAAITNDQDLEIVDYDETEHTLTIKNKTIAEGTLGAHVTVAISSILKYAHNAPKLKVFIRVIKGDQDATILHGVTRIVGYFSKTDNWNRSKIGELRDRHKGEYGVKQY